MADGRERVGRRWRGRQGAGWRALRDAVLFSVVFGAVVLANTILGLLLIEAFGTLEPQPTRVTRL